MNHVGDAMRPKTLILVAVGIFTATAAQACPACGDKLSLVGGGVSFERVSQAGPPGRIVFLAEPGSQVQAAEKDLGLVAEFKRAGHDVKVVADSDELDRVVREQGADVVIAHWSEAAATAGVWARALARPPSFQWPTSRATLPRRWPRELANVCAKPISARAGSSPRPSTRCWTSGGRVSRPIAR